jgi:hypothetical protein
MAIDLKRARNFVYAKGVLWEQALFAYLFQGDSIDRLHQCLLCYKNSDNGWGHALEHDLRCPQSNPLALEFLLSTLTQIGVPAGKLLDGSVQWLEGQRESDGSLKNPPETLDYPHASWWNDGAQTIPDSIVGNLTRLGCASESLQQTTAAWVERNLTLEKVRANKWLFMGYHAYDYFLPIRETTEGREGWQAAVENIIACTEKASPTQYYDMMRFAPSPESPVAQAMPAQLLKKCLDYLESAQRSDGSWLDEHGLPHWYPWVTIAVLNGLRAHGREIGAL